MNESAERFQSVGRLIDEFLGKEPSPERDRRLQTCVAQAMSPSERFKTLGVLMGFAIERFKAQRENSYGRRPVP